MIGRLAGRLVGQDADGTLVLDVSGVGYELVAPIGTVGRAGHDAADTTSVLTLFVHTHVREDALLLYGFASLDERSAFRHLIGISSIGPKIALNMLGALTVAELSTVIARGETARLTKVPGVGKKTAERIVLELKDKLLAPTVAGAPMQLSRPSATGGKSELLHGALTRMGYRPAEAERAIAALSARIDSDPLPDLVRDALAVLSR